MVVLSAIGIYFVRADAEITILYAQRSTFPVATSYLDKIYYPSLLPCETHAELVEEWFWRSCGVSPPQEEYNLFYRD